jgi:hypothetical protein
MNVSRQIGWGNESNLLYQILKQLNKLTSALFSLKEAATPNYKVYTALLTQTGTSAPVATVLENTIGAISFIYDGVGLYRITESSSFDVNKTALFLGPVTSGYLRNALYGPGYWGVRTYDNSNLPADGAPGNLILSNTPIEIRVYN